MADPEEWSPNQIQIARIRLRLDVLKTVRHLVKWVAFAVIAMFAWLSIEALAGKTTILEAVFEYTTRNKATVFLPWLIAIVMLVWALVERALRRRKTAQMQKHVHDLETRLDPDRTGSGLPPDGRTNPKDKLR